MGRKSPTGKLHPKFGNPALTLMQSSMQKAVVAITLLLGESEPLKTDAEQLGVQVCGGYGIRRIGSPSVFTQSSAVIN